MPVIGYPTVLPSNTKVFNTVFPERLKPDFDIVWSFDFNISGSSIAEAGITTFLISDVVTGSPLTGGNVGVDLGYSGLSAGQTTSTNVSAGILSAIVGIGFDSTGYFAVSTEHRDGMNANDINQNFLAVRGKYPQFSLIDTNSNLNKYFSVIDNTGAFTSIRCRLGNVGRTLYIDSKKESDVSYANILTIDPLPYTFTENEFVNVGISFASPIMSSDEGSVATLCIKNFHIEGRQDYPSIKEGSTGNAPPPAGNTVSRVIQILLTEDDTTISSINYGVTSVLMEPDNELYPDDPNQWFYLNI